MVGGTNIPTHKLFSKVSMHDLAKTSTYTYIIMYVQATIIPIRRLRIKLPHPVIMWLTWLVTPSYIHSLYSGRFIPYVSTLHFYSFPWRHEFMPKMHLTASPQNKNGTLASAVCIHNNYATTYSVMVVGG